MIRSLAELLKNHVAVHSPELLNKLKLIEPIIGIGTEQLLKTLIENPFDLSRFTERIKQMRTIVQKNLFSICFCENELNETLWLKYASNYRGFALVYDMKDRNTFLCGTEEECKNCRSLIERPSLYPVYYAEEAYDATRFALACLLWGEHVSTPLLELSYKAVMWEAERVSLIKKKCHEYDQEWRMIRSTMMRDRTCIKMRPIKIILGLRMPEYERRLAISAAKIAQINDIEELFINDDDRLASRIIVGS